MTSKLTLAALAAICMTAPATAAPAISGKYIIAEHRMCQAKAVYHFAPGVGESGNYVDQIVFQGGEIGNSVLLADFSPAKGKVSFSGFDAHGDASLIQLTGEQNIVQGNLLGTDAIMGNKVPYANDDTTFTLNGTVYHVFYGQVDKNNIAHYAAYQGEDTNNDGQPCSVQGTASRQ
jgi:hypothetical protein